MKPSELTAQILSEYAKATLGDEEYATLDAARKAEIEGALAAAKRFVGGYTGLDMSQADLEDITIAILTVGAEMLDNHQLTAQYTGQNPMVMQILDMHSTNLLPTPDDV